MYDFIRTNNPPEWFHNALPEVHDVAKHPEAVGTEWQDLYAAALLELDRNKLLDRIKEAEQAISIRFVGLDPTRDADEAQRISDATRGLSVLRREAK